MALYLLDRSRRRQVVSTLRFWVAAEQPAVAARRRHISQPWSLILQLVSMALLLLAIAQLRLGTPALAGRDHVIVLDTSAWMAARSGNRTLMDVARERARQYLRALPARDRVMLVRADALATPATAFEPDHRKIEAAIQASQPGSTALNLDQALAFARHVQAQEGRGGRRNRLRRRRAAPPSRDPGAAAPPRNLRVLAGAGRRRELPACARSACAAPPPIRTCGRSTFRRTITERAPRTVTLIARFRAARSTPARVAAARSA